MMRIGSVVLALAAAVALAACTPQPVAAHRSAAPSLTGPSTPPTSTVVPPRLSSTPLWTDKVLKDYTDGQPLVPVTDLAQLLLVGDALLTTGYEPGHRGTDRIVVSDAKTGAMRWSATSDDTIPGAGGSTFDFLQSARVLGDPAGDWTLVTTFKRKLSGNNYEEGIVGLSGRDGSLRWRIPVQHASRCTCPWTRLDVMILGPAAAGTVLVYILTNAVSAGTVATKVIAYDTGTRQQLWSATGISPEAVDGNLLLVTRPTLPAQEDVNTPATLSAVDLRTGTLRWNLADRYPYSRLVFAGGDTVVVERKPGTAIVDAATGRELGTTPDTLSGCGRTEAVFACHDNSAGIASPNAVVITRGGDSATVTAVPNSQRCDRVQVWGQLLYCDDATNEPQYAAAMDAAGAVAIAKLPGRLETASDTVAVFSTGGFEVNEGIFAAYAVG